MMTYYKTPVFAAVIYMSVCLFAGCKSEQDIKEQSGSKVKTSTHHVKTAPIKAAGTKNSIFTTGIVTSETEAKPAFKTGGVISRMYVSEGDFVKKGQLLATLMLNEINAQVRQAEEVAEKTERDFTRVSNLFRDSVATMEQFQNAKTAMELAKKNVEIAKFNLTYSEIRSPIDGKIVKQIMHEGEIVGPGYPLYYILGSNPTDWKLKAGLTDRDWAKVKKGDMATVRFDAYPGKNFTARVTETAIVGNPGSGTFDIELSLEQKDIRLAAGLVAQIILESTSPVPMFSIPIEALVAANGNMGTVYVPEANVAKKREVYIGPVTGEHILILGGLEKDSVVITAGAGFLEDGEPIIVD